jgi:hypothetical protein
MLCVVSHFTFFLYLHISFHNNHLPF